MWIKEQGTVLTDRDGEPTRIVGTSTDVTEERERERELQRERNRFESLFETLPEPVVLVSGERAIDSTIERVNPAFEEVFGHEEEQIAGKDLNDVVVPEDRREEAERIDRRSVGDGLPPTEVRRETADGELRDFLLMVTNFSVFGDDGVSDAFAIYADITEHKERERRFEEFASTVSHDLRNPLNVVDGRLELAREECDSDHLEDAARAVERMRTLIEDLLALARQGETAIEEGVVDLAAVADDCWRTVETNDATLVAATDRTVRADESRLRQFLENLLRNAVEHGGDGVTITLGDLDGGFYVEDDGSGIPAEDRERVFDSGYSTTRDGTGFGLAIASEIADAHGWEITVTDGETGGARFEIRGVELPPDRPAG
jgi:PAS domain S-box-containing protein